MIREQRFIDDISGDIIDITITPHGGFEGTFDRWADNSDCCDRCNLVDVENEGGRWWAIINCEICEGDRIGLLAVGGVIQNDSPMPRIGEHCDEFRGYGCTITLKPHMMDSQSIKVVNTAQLTKELRRIGAALIESRALLDGADITISCAETDMKLAASLDGMTCPWMSGSIAQILLDDVEPLTPPDADEGSAV